MPPKASEFARDANVACIDVVKMVEDDETLIPYLVELMDKIVAENGSADGIDRKRKLFKFVDWLSLSHFALGDRITTNIFQMFSRTGLGKRMVDCWIPILGKNELSSLLSLETYLVNDIKNKRKIRERIEALDFGHFSEKCEADEEKCGVINIGKLRPTYRMALTFHGHPSDQIVSAMQKYIRRGECDKALYSALDIDLFFQINKLEPTDVVYSANGSNVTAEETLKIVKAKRTNLMNRLLVICLEDVGLAAPGALFKFETLRKQWVMHRESIEQQYIAKRALVQIVTMLCKLKKSRSVSDIKSVYFVRPMWTYIQDNERWKKFYEPPEPTKGAGKKYYGNEFIISVRKHLDGFVTELKAKSDYVFYWQSLLFGEIGEAETMKIVYKILKDNAEEAKDSQLAKAIDILSSKDYYGHFKNSDRDKWLFFIYPVLLSITVNQVGAGGKDAINWDFNFIGYNVTSMTAVEIGGDEGVKELYKKHMNSTDEFEIDDYCIDMHTAKGKKCGKTSFDFLTTGSFVENQEDRVINKEHRQIYGYLKIVSPRDLNLDPSSDEAQALFKSLGIEFEYAEGDGSDDGYESDDRDEGSDDGDDTYKQYTEKTRFVNPLRAQLTCAAHRQDVYFAYDVMTKSRVVVKGPYDSIVANWKDALSLNSIKKYFKRVTPMKMEMVQLQSNQWIDVPLGIRNKMNSEGVVYRDFLVMEDVCHRVDEGEGGKGGAEGKDLDINANGFASIPSMEKGSKVWPADTLVYDGKTDFESTNCGELSIIKIDEEYGGEGGDDEFKINVILAYIFRYIWEITDTCDRNFIVDYKRKIVYSIDEDNFFSGKKTYLTGNRDVPAKGGQDKIFKRWLGEYKKRIIAILKEWEKSIKNKNNSGEIWKLQNHKSLTPDRGTWFEVVISNLKDAIGLVSEESNG